MVDTVSRTTPCQDAFPRNIDIFVRGWRFPRLVIRRLGVQLGYLLAATIRCFLSFVGLEGRRRWFVGRFRRSRDRCLTHAHKSFSDGRNFIIIIGMISEDVTVHLLHSCCPSSFERYRHISSPFLPRRRVAFIGGNESLANERGVAKARLSERVESRPYILL